MAPWIVLLNKINYDLISASLEPPPSGPGTLGRPLHSCPKGLLIRAVWPSGPFPSLELETVWVTRDVLLPDGTAATVLDEHPLIWRERWP